MMSTECRPVKWQQWLIGDNLLVLQPGPDAIGIIAISHGCVGIAARACGLVALEPSKVTEILKDRPAWLQDCRRMEVLGAVSTGNGGTVELLYTQVPFWLLGAVIFRIVWKGQPLTPASTCKFGTSSIKVMCTVACQTDPISVCVQMYAPTTLAPARDFCTLRYTTVLEDGNLVVCIFYFLSRGGLMLKISSVGAIWWWSTF